MSLQQDRPDWSNILTTDASGRAVPFVPEFLGIAHDQASGFVILDASVHLGPNEAFYLYGWDIVVPAGGTAGLYQLLLPNSPNRLAQTWVVAGGSSHVELNGFKAIFDVVLQAAGALNDVTIRYEIGPS